jgi:predicted transcriptional regulator
MTVELAPEMEARIRKIATDTHVTEDFVVQTALERFVEDREDYAAGIHALATMKYTVSLDEVERKSNVAD